MRNNNKQQPILLVVNCTGKINISLSAFAPEIWSRETGYAVPSRVSLLISILRLNLVLTNEIPPEFRGSVYLFIGSVPSLSSHAVVCRWHSLPRVRRQRASKPQGSSKRVLPWQVTMDRLIFASLSHIIRYWYEVGMLKVPAYIYYSDIGITHIYHISVVVVIIVYLTLTDPPRAQLWSQNT